MLCLPIAKKCFQGILAKQFGSNLELFLFHRFSNIYTYRVFVYSVQEPARPLILDPIFSPNLFLHFLIFQHYRLNWFSKIA